MVTLNLNESKAVAKTAMFATNANFFVATKHRDAAIENNNIYASIRKKNVKPPILGLVIAKSDLKNTPYKKVLVS